MGLSYTFNDDNIQVAVVDPNVEIDIVFVVGYGLVTDFPLQRITEAGLG
jgi:hypothetical protein